MNATNKYGYFDDFGCLVLLRPEQAIQYARNGETVYELVPIESDELEDALVEAQESPI